MPKTLLLSRSEVARAVSLRDLAGAVGDGFIRHSSAPQPAALRASATVDGATTRVSYPGLLEGYGVYTVRVDLHLGLGLDPRRPLPSSAVLLVDRESGEVRAILEGTVMSAMCAAAAGALAVTALARAGAGRVALFGAGLLGTWQLGALHAIGRLESARVFDLDGSRSHQLADELTRQLGVETRAAASPAEAASDADILITVTPSRTPFITGELARKGVHINALGADEPGKVEVATEVLRRARLVVDDRATALASGALNMAAAAGELDGSAIHAELGDVLTGRRAGRQRDDEITLFASVGLALQDLVASRLVYQRAIDAGLGTWIEFTA